VSLQGRSGLQPHVVWAALGVTIEREEEHDALWGHLGIERPDGWRHGLSYSLDDSTATRSRAWRASAVSGCESASSATRRKPSRPGPAKLLFLRT